MFYRLRTQWNVGMSGATGLRYEAITLAMELEGVARGNWPQVMDGVQVMEHETLRIWRDMRK